MKKNVLLAAFTGTSLMTAFSYYMSYKRKKKFEEPKILGQLFHRLEPDVNDANAQVSGWIMHYSVGLLFAVIYKFIFTKYKIEKTFMKSVYIGFLSGILAIAVWHATLKIHPNAPSINLKKYYAVLMAAHIIFGFFTINTLRANTGKLAAADQ